MDMDHHVSHRPTILLMDDLLGTMLVLAACVLAFLLELTRRRMLSVFQLCFFILAWVCLLIFGGLMDHFVSNEYLNWALFGSWSPSNPHVWAQLYLPFMSGAILLALYLFRISSCACVCCCQQRQRSDKHFDHENCFQIRLKSALSLYLVSMFWLFMCMGVRFNARLRGSAIRPEGGTLHWRMLTCPLYLSGCHIGSVFLLFLYKFLKHADGRSCQRWSERKCDALDKDMVAVNERLWQPSEAMYGMKNAAFQPTNSLRSSQLGLFTEKSNNRVKPSIRTPSFSSYSMSTAPSPPSSPVSTVSAASHSSAYRANLAASMASTRHTAPTLRTMRKKETSGTLRPAFVSTKGSATSLSSSPAAGSIGDSEDPIQNSNVSVDSYSDNLHSLRNGLRQRRILPNNLKAEELKESQPVQLVIDNGYGRSKEPFQASSKPNNKYRSTNWTEYFDTVSQNVYQHNPETGETRWKI